ncbi:MAG TPA: formate dehydrogenase subunit gamma [Alphaproteobacteria bacterium]
MASTRGALIKLIGIAALALAVAAGGAPALAQQQPAGKDVQLLPPPGGQDNDVEVWRAVRGGVTGSVSIPDKKAGVLVQSGGQAWRAIRNGPVSTYGVWLLLGTVALLALFFALRGRIRIEHGRSGRRVLRFAGFERLVHWITAVSFILLALSGLNMLYGRYVLKPYMGAEGFSALTMAGKVLHDYVGFVFIAGIAIMLVMWIRHNVPRVVDLAWLARGGGMVGHDHPPAYKFNAGQKIIFAAVIIVGGMISYSGVSLVFPFETAATVQGMQDLQLWHAVLSLVMMALIIAHIYIGTLGMEGAFEAMRSGYVDETWAREHHSLWVAELEAEGKAAPEGARAAPAE